MSNRPVTSISARKRGTTRFLTGSTPSTCSASSSSRILRAPRSAVIAVPATPASTIAVTNGANSRIEASTKKPPRRSMRAEEDQEVGGLQPRRAVAEGDRRDQQRKPAQPQREQELRDELAAVGYGGRRAETIVLPVRIIMSPTSSSTFLAGRNARSATLRTTSLSSSRRTRRRLQPGATEQIYATSPRRAANTQPTGLHRRRAVAGVVVAFRARVRRGRSRSWTVHVALASAACGSRRLRRAASGRTRTSRRAPTGRRRRARASRRSQRLAEQRARFAVDVRNAATRDDPATSP